MVRYSHCCFCFDVRKGIIAYLINSTIATLIMVIRNQITIKYEYDWLFEYKPVYYFIMAIDIIHIILSMFTTALAIYGIVKGKDPYLLPALFIQMFGIVVSFNSFDKRCYSDLSNNRTGTTINFPKKILPIMKF